MKFFKWLIKTLIYIIILLIIIILVFFIFTFMFSRKNNMSVEDTLIHFETIGTEFIDYKLTDKNSIDITLDIAENTNITNDHSQNAINSNNTINYYYYNQLDSTSKIIYDALEDNIDNLKKKNFVINFNTQFNDLLHTSTGQYTLNKAFQSSLDAFFYDHPNIFYLDTSKLSLIVTSASLGPLTKYTVKLEPKDGVNYLIDSYTSEMDVENAIIEVEKIRDNAINQLKDDNDYSKILKVHNMLVNSIEYDSTSNKKNTHNIYGALIERKVVCEGYAKAFKYILDSLDIECILVCGNAKNSSGKTESHMWNYVKLDDNWYGIDVTWDDPIIIGGYKKNNIRHDYFLKGKSTFIESHSPSGKISDNGMLFKLPSLADKNYK